MRRFHFLVLVLFLAILLAFPGVVWADNPVSFINAEGELLANLTAVEEGDEPWIDLGDYLRSLGYSLSWDPLLERLTARSGEKEVRLQSDSRRTYLNGNLERLSTSPIFRDDRMYFPARDVDEVVAPGEDKTVHWNSNRRQIQVLNSRQAERVARGDDPLGDIIADRPDLDAGQMLVVIDPGHGGRDPGAIGPGGLMEKDVVLEISLLLRDVLEQKPDIEVHMTRTTDEFIPLEQRARQANELDADLFLSMHANSGPSSSATGFEVYTLSYDSGDVTDAEAAERAEAENSVLWQFEGMEREEVDQDLAFIIDQLHVSTNARNSQEFANLLEEDLERRMDVPNRGHKRAPFYVLNRAQMPAVLLEVGFLSNPEEELRLQTDEYQQTLTETVADVLDRYRQELF